MMLLDSPFFRFLASKLGEGQVLFLLRLETVDPGTGMVWCCKYFSPRRQILQQEKIISVGKVFTCCESCLVIWSELIWCEFLQIRVPAQSQPMMMSDVYYVSFIDFISILDYFSAAACFFLSDSHFTWCGGTLYLLFRLYTRYNKTMYLTTRGACQVFPRLCHIQMSDPKLLHG